MTRMILAMGIKFIALATLAIIDRELERKREVGRHIP